MKLFLEGSPKGKETKNGKEYYDEMQDEFWKKPGKYNYIIFQFLIDLFTNSLIH